MRDKIRFFNKHFLNPIMLLFAGTAHNPHAIVTHTGRVSGKSYRTPIIVVPIENGFFVALTYGPKVDWYQNVLAAGHCQILWQGKEYQIKKIATAEAKTALPLFPLFARVLLPILKVNDFVKMSFS